MCACSRRCSGRWTAATASCVPTDAICSSSDRTHDALLTLYRERYGQQVETVPSEEILRAWE